MSEVLRCIFGVAASTFAGWHIVRLVLRNRDYCAPTERLAYSYGAGVAYVSIVLYLIALTGMKLTLFVACAVTVLPYLFTSVCVRCECSRGGDFDRRDICQTKNADAVKWLSILCACSIIFESLYAFFRALIRPLEAYDAVAMYAIKAKMFYLAAGIPAEFFKAYVSIFPHGDYPLNISLYETYLYIMMGSLNDQLVKVIFPLFFVSVLALLFAMVRRVGGRTYALFFVFLLATIPQWNAYATNGYVDLPLAFYGAASIFLLYRWTRNPQEVYLLAFSGLMTGMACWTKNEGVLYAAINTLLVLVYTFINKRTDGMRLARCLAGVVIYCAMMALCALPWVLTKQHFNLTNSDLGSAAGMVNMFTERMGRIGLILYGMQREIFNVKKWNLVWPILIGVAAFRFRRVYSRDVVMLSAWLVLAVLGYMAVYLLAETDAAYLVRTTWSRFTLHFLPVALFWCACAIKEDTAE